MELQRIAYCGVDCYECGSYKRGACTGCRAAEWEEDDICKPVACCRAKGISFCRECGEFPCEEMRAFYEESENHRRAYRRMRGEEVGECDSSLLDLVGFDGKCVRVTMTDGQVLEGICCHNSADYGEWELGNREESLQLLNYVVYSGSIKKVESLEEHDGPYGRFSGPFGQLEEMTVTDFPDFFCDSFDYGEPEHELQLLRCAEAYLSHEDGRELGDPDGLLKAIAGVSETAETEEVRSAAKALFEKYRGSVK
ncbi:MAG: DUF3795 domain-containing protein [Clostridia bacterium]|nr:DUF3795 domain-containing protein [Clostridia bacterium]